jgi:uncharacterized protein YdcH (DUF465 family)
MTTGGWSVEALRAHIDDVRLHLTVMAEAAAELTRQRFEDQDKAVIAALAAQEKAVAAALASADRAVAVLATSTEKRLEGLNEFRQQLSDLIRTLISRDEALQRIEALGDKLDQVTARFEQADKASQVRYDEKMRENALKIADLSSRLDTRDGRTSGVGASWQLVVGIVLLVAAVVGMYVALLNP